MDPRKQSSDTAVARTSFREMVAKKREEVQALSSVSGKLAKVHSVSMIASKTQSTGSSGNLIAGSGGLLNPVKRKVSHHASVGDMTTVNARPMPRALPALQKQSSMPLASIGSPPQDSDIRVGRQEAASKKSSLGHADAVLGSLRSFDVKNGTTASGRPRSAGKHLPEHKILTGSRLVPSLSHSSSLGDISSRNSVASRNSVGQTAMSVQPSPAPIDKGRPGSAGRRFPSMPLLQHEPSQDRHADEDEDPHNDFSNMDRSTRSSVTSIASFSTDASMSSYRRPSKTTDDLSTSRKQNRPKKRQFKPPPELPRWNVSTKPANAIRKQRKAKEESQPEASEIRRSTSQNAIDELDQAHTLENVDIPVELSPSTQYVDEPEDEYLETKYPVTPYQMDIYIKICPTRDELDSSNTSLYSGPPLYISQAYRIDSRMRPTDLAKILKRVCNAYIVLRTHFYRNERIIDADVEGLLDRQDWRNISDDEHLEVVDVRDHPSLSVLNSKTLTGFVRQWMRDRERLDKTFTALLFNEGTRAKPGGSTAWLVFVVSTAVADETTCSWVAREVLTLYAKCDRMRVKGASDADVERVIDEYDVKEHYDFINYAYDLESRPNRHALTYWKQQCIETVQEAVDQNEKEEIGAQLSKLEKEKVGLQSQVDRMRKRKADLESELGTQTNQRKQMEVDDTEMMTYLDPASGEVIRISRASKAALFRTVLGEEAGVDGTIIPFLKKHEVPAEVQQRLHASTMSMEAFASLTENQVSDAGLLTKDRRKIMALSEHVRNGIKECLQEEGRIKHTLERRIAKLGRDLESCSESLKLAQNALDTNDDMCIRLGNILKPPYVEIKVPSLTLEQQYVEPAMEKEISDYADMWDFAPLTVSQELLQNLRLFQDGWHAATRRKRGHSVDRRAGSASGASTEETSEMDSEDPHLGLGAREHRRTLSSAAAVCLAAFAVVLKHASGSDKFLLGVTQSFRRNGLLVGPVTDTLPVKIDFTRKGTTFNSLFGTLSRSLREVRRYGPGCPLTTIQSKLGVARELPVQFEYISFRDQQTWARKGLPMEGLLQTDTPFVANEADPAMVLKAERSWFMNEARPFDMKLVLIETTNSLMGGIRYRRDKFEADHVGKWITKYLATLEAIDTGPRQIQISSIISRFYQTLWHGGSSANLLGSVVSAESGSTPDAGHQVTPIAEE